MPELSTLITFTLACCAIIIVPGPTVTVIIANALRAGPFAGLANVAGTQAGLAIMIAIMALGLETVMALMGEFYIWLKLAGAAYLVWLGIKLWRSNGALADASDVNVRAQSASGFFWQGFFVIWSNPKALFFFGAFIPQFITPAADAAAQTLLLGGIFMICAMVLDGAYAVLAGRAGRLLTRIRIKAVERVSGSFMIAGGIWLAMTRRA